MHRVPYWPAAALALAIGLSPAAMAAVDQAPTLRLFPTTVLEDIRHTGEVAREMETGLQAIIARLDEQQAAFVAARCDGATGDAGCDAMAREMGATYLEMLDVMATGLPDMEAAVNSTQESLRGRLRDELGRRMSTSELQDVLTGRAGESLAAPAAAARQGGLRLSDRFRKYYQLVNNAGTRNARPLAVLASDIYLDMREASALIAQTREEINRARLMEQLNQSFGNLTPEMEQVVAGVKNTLFGDVVAESEVPDSPVSRQNETWTSPLEM